jgi:hypothetical protein
MSLHILLIKRLNAPIILLDKPKPAAEDWRTLSIRRAKGLFKSISS